MKPSREDYLGTIGLRLANNSIVALTGPRQVGKTTLARLYAATLKKEIHHFDLESPSDLARLVFHQGKRIGFEFKYSERPSTTKSMRVAIEDLRLDHLYVVHPGENSFPLDAGITETSLTDLLKTLKSP